MLAGPGFAVGLSADHGEIAVDPATGVLRITLRADATSASSWEAGIAAFGPVLLGDPTYSCPRKSIAISRLPIFAKDVDRPIRKLPRKCTWAKQ